MDAGPVAPVLGLSEVASVLVWLGVLILIVALLGLAILAVRRRLLGPSEMSGGPASALTELRDMRDRGQITPEEFERARTRIVARMKASLANAKSDSTNPPRPSG